MYVYFEFWTLWLYLNTVLSLPKWNLIQLFYLFKLSVLRGPTPPDLLLLRLKVYHTEKIICIYSIACTSVSLTAFMHLEDFFYTLQFCQWEHSGLYEASQECVLMCFSLRRACLGCFQSITAAERKHPVENKYDIVKESTAPFSVCT